MWIRRNCSLWLGVWLCTVFQAAWGLDFGRMRPEEVAVYVADADSGAVLVAHRADASMNPASTMKLVTTFAALRALGPQYRWRTEWKSDAPVSGGVLQGDLYWLGSGNPVFDQPDIQDMQAQLRLAGIQHIGGRVVLDRNHWREQAKAEGFEADEGELFVTPPDPHMVAYKVLWATAGVGADGSPQFVTEPPLPGVLHDNQVRWRSGAVRCGRLANHVRIAYQNGVLQFAGHLPAACTGEKMHANIMGAPEFARASFRGQWLASGGNDVGFAEGTTPAGARLLALHHAKPLSAILADMNMFSNNLIARSVFMQIGRERNGGDSLHNAHVAVRRELVAAGLDDEALVLENGSGLSRRERLTARFLGQMLQRAWHSPWRDDFVAGLPAAGDSGTLKTRLRQMGPGLRLKTGTLNNVRALAGYWLAQQPGQRNLAVVVLVNAEGSGGYLADLDRLTANLVQKARGLENVQP